jgi:hypothetical protein
MGVYYIVYMIFLAILTTAKKFHRKSVVILKQVDGSDKRLLYCDGSDHSCITLDTLN